MRPSPPLRALAAAALLACAAGPARADLIDIIATADGVATDGNGDGTFDALNTANGGSGLVVSDFEPDTFPGENRAILEFDLSGLPAGATLDAVAFRFSIASVTSDAAAVRVLGLAGDGAVTLSDAAAAGAALLGSFNTEALGLGVATVALDLSALSGSLGGGSLLTLVLDGLESNNTSLGSLELAGAVFVPPSLVVSYTPAAAAIPEPASMTLLGAGGLGLLGYARRRKAKATA